MTFASAAAISVVFVKTGVGESVLVQIRERRFVEHPVQKVVCFVLKEQGLPKVLHLSMSRRASVFARNNPGKRRVRFPDEVIFEEEIKDQGWSC